VGERVRDGLRRVDPYLVVGAGLVLYTVLVALHHPWSGDFGVHAATVERLKVDFWHPGNPMVAADGPSAYYTPYTLLLGLIARATGWSGRTVLEVISPFAVLLFLVGVRRFVRVFTHARWAPVLALACLLLLWGTTHLAWSGFTSLFGFPLITAYPSFVATGATLLWWAMYARALDRQLDRPRGPRRFVWLGVFGAAIVLTHPFTAVIAALGAIALTITFARAPVLRRTWVAIGASAVGAGILLALWPYYSFFSLVGAESFDDIHRPLYANAWGYYGLAAVTLPALWLRWRRDRLDPLVLLFALSAAVVLIGGVTGRYALGRIWPGVLIAGQVALAIELADCRDLLRRPLGRVMVPLAALALVIGLYAQAGNLLLALPPSRAGHLRSDLGTSRPGPDLAWTRALAAPGDVVLTDDARALQALPGYGLRTLVAAWPDPFLDDAATRRDDQRTILDPTTPADVRAKLLDRYRVRWMLVPANSPLPADAWGLELATTGPGGTRLYRRPS